MKNYQTNIWTDKFGKNYTKRNYMSFEEMEILTKKRFDITRTDINNLFFKNIDFNISILEVGTNIGNQLICFKKMDYINLFGVDIQLNALKINKFNNPSFLLSKSDGYYLPFKDNSFDLIFTSGVLIHIPPENIKIFMKEIIRCSKKYIFGFEYFNEDYKEIIYHNEKNLLWKANFPKVYLDIEKKLKLINKIKYKYRNKDLFDIVFLLEKQ